MVKSDKELYSIWKKYIDVPIYRVVPLRDVASIRKGGINPKKDPYEKVKPKLRKLFDLVFRLERKGQRLELKWGNKIVSGSYAVKTTVSDLSNPYVDFSPQKGSIAYYSSMPGGALVTNIKKITDQIIKSNPQISKENWKLVKDINKWAKKMQCPMKTLVVKGSSKYFENARFQLLKKTKKLKGKKKRYYLPNIFGSFEHFKKMIKKQGFRKYSNRLKNKGFYLRLVDKIPSKEIKFIR